MALSLPIMPVIGCTYTGNKTSYLSYPRAVQAILVRIECRNYTLKTITKLLLPTGVDGGSIEGWEYSC